MDWTARKKNLVPERKEERRGFVVLSCVKKPRHKILWPIPSSVNVKKSGESKGFCLTFFPFRVILHTSSECAGRQSTPISSTISSGHYPHHMCMCLNYVSKHFQNTKYTMCMCLSMVADFFENGYPPPPSSPFCRIYPSQRHNRPPTLEITTRNFPKYHFFNLQKNPKFSFFS